jgi:hypothetical protein
MFQTWAVMKHQTKCAVLLVLLLPIGYSCKKNRDQPAANFAGTYGGTVTQQGVNKPDSFVLNSTANPDMFSFYNPADSLYLTLKVSGDSIVSINGGGTTYGSCSVDTVSGFGSLSGNVLQYTIFDAFTCNGVHIVDTLSVVATRM